MLQEQNQEKISFLLDGVAVPVRVHATREELAHISPDLEAAWKRAELAGARAQSENDRGIAIGRQLTCALLQCSIANQANRWLPALIATLVEREQWSARLALTWTDQMEDRRLRVHTLLALAPLLPESEFPQLLAVLRSTRPYRSVLFLPTEILHKGILPEGRHILEPLGAIVDDDSRPEKFYLDTLAKLVHHLPLALRREAIDEIIGVALDRGFYPDRNEPLDEIVRYLSETELQRALEVAQGLPEFRELYHDNQRAESLLALLPRWAQLGHAQEALRIADELTRRGAETISLCFARIADALPPAPRLTLLKRLRQPALNLESEWDRARVILELAILLAKHGYFDEALETVDWDGPEKLRLWAKARLMEHLPTELRHGIVDTLLSRSATIRGNERSPTLQSLVIELVRQRDVSTALGYIKEFFAGYYYWWEQEELVEPIVLLFAEQGFSEELFEKVQSLDSTQGRTHLFCFPFWHAI